MNEVDRKVFVRDNLKHEDLTSQEFRDETCEDKREYGLVLGWNRLCIERSANR